MLRLFVEPTWLLDGVSSFLRGEFSLFQGKLRKHPRSFNWHLNYKKICLINFGEIQNCCFWHILHSCVCKIWFFPNSERKKKPVLVPIVKIIHRLECAWYTFLDHPKTLVFRVIKTKIIFNYLHAGPICTCFSVT